MVTVNVDYSVGKPDVALNKALRKFKRELEKEEVMDEAKKRQYYLKPSAKAHKKKVHYEHVQRKIKKDAEKARNSGTLEEGTR